MGERIEGCAQHYHQACRDLSAALYALSPTDSDSHPTITPTRLTVVLLYGMRRWQQLDEKDIHDTLLVANAILERERS